MNLDDLPSGGKATILEIAGEGSVPLRLLEMGLLPDSEVTLLRRAPFGDPLEVEVLGYRLLLRSREASTIRVRVRP